MRSISLIISIPLITLLFLLIPHLPAIAGSPEEVARLESIYIAQNGYLKPEQIKEFESLSPEERERIIKNYKEFQKLPPWRRRELRKRYRRWMEMSPEEREKLKRLYEKLKKKGLK